MIPLSYAEFTKLYLAELSEALAFLTPQMQEAMARHNRGWAVDSMDFEQYLRASAKRFHLAYLALCKGRADSACDIGGFWGIFSITLKKLGMPQVAMTETLHYYGSAFDGLFGHIRANGVEIIDYDPFVPGALLDRTFDFVSAMAIIEHYPHSLRPFMENTRAIMAEHGRYYIEVPNIAFFSKRLAMLFGHTPLTNLRAIYESATPFTGHHHEFTLTELHELVELAGLEVIDEITYNYSLPAGLYPYIRIPLTMLFSAVHKASRECLAVLCRKSGGSEVDPRRDLSTKKPVPAASSDGPRGHFTILSP